MHERQVAWLDGKPQNVLCTNYEDSSSLQVTVCDFGASNVFECGNDIKLLPVAVGSFAESRCHLIIYMSAHLGVLVSDAPRSVKLCCFSSVCM